MSDSMQLIGGQNPDLIDPAMLQNAQAQQGKVQGFTQPFKFLQLAEPFYFTMTLRNHHMYRTDGKRMLFIDGMFEALDYHDAKYLIDEINAGIPGVRRSTPEEINRFKMARDPVGTVLQQVTPQIEKKVRDELMDELKSLGVVLSDEQQAALRKLQEKTAESNAEVDAAKIAGTSPLDKLKEGIRSGSGTVNITGPAAQQPQLGGIAGTDRMANAAPSNQTGS